MKKIVFLLLFIPLFAFAESMYSPTWGFYLDLPEGYEFVHGDARDRFSFAGPGGLLFDMVIYNDRYASMPELIDDVNRRIGNRGETAAFRYRERQAALMKLIFGNFDGWGLVIELESRTGGRPPMLLALAYGPASRNDLELFHISALDSICPTAADRRYPGPVIEYSYPRGEAKSVPLAVAGVSAMIRENDATAAQTLIEREFYILQHYIDSPNWKEAWIRYYQFIYRDSYDRIATAASALARNFGWRAAFSDEEKRAFSQKVLGFVQGFRYERDLNGSDFVNLVTAITEGRGDCDSRAMLFAIVLANTNIRSAIMLSRQYSHAMGLADVTGAGARFESYETRWLVAETVANVDIGLIAQDISDPQYWLGVVFEYQDE
ncbi:MAG: hypothetical protein LBI28_00320 [Treponema sp.]|jgi:hypothetical protein|nr:hypothetical protein [Treponema sp.]